MTPYIDIQNLTKSFGDRLILDDISLSIAQGQRIGIVAKNGTGKSTLLRIIEGKEPYDEGKITLKRDLTLGFLEQSPSFDDDEMVLDACFNHEGKEEQILKAKQILTQLRLGNFDRHMGELSGGERKRVALANVLITQPDILILDEPTNHLDIEMIEWLERYLSHGNKTLLMVTHDRFFLDRVCNVIIEIDNAKIYNYRGNYAYYLEKRQERIDNTRAEIERANNLYRRELEWMRRMPQARATKARYREKAFYELEQKAKQKIEERQIRLKSKNVYIGNKIFEAQYVSKSFNNGQTVVLKDFYYNFARFEKMGLIGNNGAGKSSFVKLLLGEIKPDAGKFDIGDTVRFGYFSQDEMKTNPEQKVIDVIKNIAEYIDFGGGRHITASQLLQHFLFTPEQQHNYVYKLSGGERRKLHLCTVLMRNPNFLVLDEPTNDLDIQTLQVLEEYLADFPGCVIIVSHDRYFMDKVVDHLLVFKGGGVIKDFPGNYTQYREWIDNTETTDSDNTKKDAKTKPKTKTKTQERRLTYKEKRELEQLEREIELLEQEKSKAEEALSSGNISIEEITQLSKRLPILNEELDEKSTRWLELSCI